MKWFKHDSDASNDAKLRKLRHKYGAQGYGVYWYCLELIARNVDEHNLTFELEHDSELIADDFKLSHELVQEMMIFMVNLGLFENDQGVITCLKMLTRTDEYTRKLIAKQNNCPDKLPTDSGQSPRKSALLEEKRREERVKDSPTPPSGLQEVTNYFQEKGYTKEAAERFFTTYEELNWYDTNDKPVRSWKAKANTVWFKPENKMTNGHGKVVL